MLLGLPLRKLKKIWLNLAEPGRHTSMWGWSRSGGFRRSAGDSGAALSLHESPSYDPFWESWGVLVGTF